MLSQMQHSSQVGRTKQNALCILSLCSWDAWGWFLFLCVSLMCWDPLGDAFPAPHASELEKTSQLSARERRRLAKQSERPQVVCFTHTRTQTVHGCTYWTVCSYATCVCALVCLVFSGCFRDELLPVTTLATVRSAPATQVTGCSWKQSPEDRGGAGTGQAVWGLSVIVATQLVQHKRCSFADYVFV